MRAVLSLVLLVTVMVPGPASARPAAGLEILQVADANWVLPVDRDSALFFFAGGVHLAPVVPEGVVTMGYVGKGECRIDRFGFGRSITCVGSGRARPLDPGGFTVDPALNSASLRIDSARFDHAVDWQGTGDAPDGSTNTSFGGSGVGVTAEMFRSALASGSVFGTDVAGGRHEFSFLAQGAGVSAWATEDYRFFEDGTVRVRRTFHF